jgi:hypothetical protein
MWALLDPLSPANLFLDNSHTYTRDNTKDFRTWVVRVIEHMNITFVLINTYRFPAVHPPYIYWAHPSREMLDWIEAAIDKAGKCHVIVHYPVDHHWWIRSSSGKTFEEIMQSPNIQVIYSGHFHPKDPMIVHHGQGGVEYVGPGAYQRSTFGLITIDNGRFVYHTVVFIEVQRKFFVTHPIPLEQVSSHQAFNDGDTEVRVICYLDHPAVIECAGAVSGVLAFVRTLGNGAQLYAMPLKLGEGEYEIRLKCTEQKWNTTRRFVIGKSFQGFREPTPCFQRQFLFVKLTGIPLFLVLIWMLLPIGENESRAIERWISGESKESQWTWAILLGPNCVRTRLRALPRSLRLWLFGLLLWPLILPMHFFKPIHGVHGWSFLCFVLVGKHILYDEWAVHMCVFYLFLVIVPGVQFASSIALLESRPPLFYFIWVKTLVWWGGLCMINYRWVGESVVWPLLFVNPTFVLVPFFIQYLVWRTAFGTTQSESIEFELTEEIPRSLLL